MKGNWHFVACSAAAGIAGAFFQPGWFITFAVAAVVLGFGLWKAWRVAAVCSLTFILAFCYFHYIDSHNTSNISSEQTYFNGTIISLPELDGDHFSFRLKLSNEEKVRVVYYLDNKRQIPAMDSFRYGMACSFQGKIEKPRKASNFYGFDYRQYLYRQGIHWQLTPDSLSGSSCKARDYSFYDRLRQWRGSGIHWIESHFPSNIRGISEALLFGERVNVPDDILDSYQDLGIVHLLAVSGLHVGLVVGALYFLMIRIGITKERSVELLFLLLPLYIIMTGAAPSAVRAGCMAMVVLLALRFRRRIHPLDGISWIALLMLSVDPYALFQVGFQLSFLVSFTLIVSAPYIQRHYESSLSQLIAISAVSQLIALPILLCRFYSISILSLPLNLIFIPFVSFFVLPFVFLSFFASLAIPALGELLVSFLSLIVRFAHGLLLEIHSWPWGTLIFGKPSLMIVLLLYVVIFYGLLKWEIGKGRHRFMVPLAALAAVCLFQWCAPYFSDEGKITMLDVGQGDSILIELPHRKAVYLIDTGGTVTFGEEKWEKREHPFKIGKDIVFPELKARGIRTIDRLILTHGDGDHIGGAEALLGNINIKEILYGKGEITVPLAQKLLSRANGLGVKIVRAGEGMSWKTGEALFAVLNPTGEQREDNARSIVLRARLGGLTWLFTGDLEKDGESRLKTDYSNLKADVLKVGHHGSKTSTSESFLTRVAPRVALISVGENNMYGHPSDEVIERLKEHGVKILRTDQMGAIQFRYNEGEKWFDWVIK